MKSKVYIISELCGQWGGDIHRAEQMILQCKMFGADAVKLQLYDTYKMPGDNREKWEYLMITKDIFDRLYNYACSLNIDLLASAFDAERFKWITQRKLKYNKIASSLLETNFELCRDMVADVNLKTFISLGKWDYKTRGLPFPELPHVKYLHCVSKYPHTPQEGLLSLPESFDKQLIGYSDHTTDLETCKEAVRRGARVIEKHFTISREYQCETESAHVCSMTYRELEELRIWCDLNV